MYILVQCKEHPLFLFNFALDPDPLTFTTSIGFRVANPYILPMASCLISFNLDLSLYILGLVSFHSLNIFSFCQKFIELLNLILIQRNKELFCLKTNKIILHIKLI